MLELKGIKKVYPAGNGVVEALKGIDLQFRKSEFVSILGPSGCGKTTLLNIVGGLDKYTEGDLVINGRSTKEFKDRDWDSYRNHSIGFVFQSYNLIPHQTVLQNVELALTLSGVSKSERRARAKKALEEVGLGDQLNKRPNAMSGGQMQRVAIARALVNNPDIILADEPTGALDTETSVQVMEILKNISKDRLIVMVTHNPELAEQYSSRIIRMLDGVITSDSEPLSEEEIKAEREACQAQIDANKGKKVKKPSMSFGTSFMLSLKNLFTKKGRTTLTAFAGSIGIIGIALILAISQGMTTYIDAVQETTLASYPLTLQATTVEMSTLMETFMNLHSDNEEHDKDAVYKKGSLYNMLNALNDLEERENDLKSFKKFLEAEMKKEGSALYEAVNGIQYSYNLNLQVYTKNVDGEIIYSDLEDIMTEVMMKALDMDEAFMESMQSMTSMSSSMGSMSSMGGMSAMTRLWQELLPGTNGAPVNDLILEQYDVVYGSWPNDYNEVVLVLDENNELDDLTLYALGLIEEKDIDALCDALKNGTKLDTSLKSWSYEEVCDREYKVILAADCYKYDEAQNKYIDLRNEKNGLDILYSNAMELKVTGVVRPAEDADATLISGGIAYTSDLTKHVIEKAEGLDVIEAQKKNPTVDVLTGLPFEPESDENDDANVVTDKDEKNAQAFKDYIAKLDEAGKAQAYITIKSIPSDEFVNAQVAQAMQGMTADIVRQQLMQAIAGQSSVDAATIEEYFNSLTDDEVMEMMKEAIAAQIVEGYAAQVKAQMASASAAELAMGLAMEMDTYTVKECSKYYLAVAEFSTSTYENNLIEMGYVDIESPAAINLYASSFENKDVIADAIADYNEGKKEMEQIKYTDYIGIMMSSITTVIDAITYVLIAFVSISLIVSSIMIGVITLISVQERTKEIGILRAIGASKRNVSGMFNAETVIVGFAAGFLGVMVTYILCIPINIILHEVTGIANLNAILPVPAAIILVAISVVLTLISGIIPSRSAAKKDPVVALRTE